MIRANFCRRDRGSKHVLLWWNEFLTILLCTLAQEFESNQKILFYHLIAPLRNESRVFEVIGMLTFDIYIEYVFSELYHTNRKTAYYHRWFIAIFNTKMKQISKRITFPMSPVAAIALVTLITGYILFLMGRETICTCGYIKLWEGDNFSPGNSQHLSDWYTFSHIIHGFIFYYLIRSWFPKLSPVMQLGVALIIEAGWEILENSPMVIDRYRTTTASIDYYGDSIVNSLSDILAMVLGYYAATRIPGKVILCVAILMELTTTYFIRDALIFNIIMLVYPFQSIKAWQMAIAPL